MSQMMIQAAVTMNQLQNKLDLIGNNMANSQTTGYKSRQAEFSSLLTQQVNNLTDPANAQGRLTPDGIRVGSGSRLGSTNMNLNQGAIQETNRDLDVALTSENLLFQVEVTENGQVGTRYTRDGSFYLSPMENGQMMLSTSDGNPVIGNNGPILIQDGFDSIEINEYGQLLVERNGQQAIEDQLSVVEAIRPRLLESTGQNLFQLPNLEALGFNAEEIIQETNPQTAILQSKALEQSNVDISKEMSDLLMTQRLYQFNSRTITMGDQMMGLVNQIRS
ncbi:flagellar hook-basal body protein [Oceanobacillus iheyensis HTE831]|uniref:Flagellar hook-basal body protein n=1 Tax=Oceanobacillus iheyensis (strain DSM 14371 / CIP 107618 / JCM 11309 / KCTC 3954 / HTE831) TaxID=221109 RepID=Q8EMA1_OCEIH|nr:flagellar hook-basal body protein [Oceanobacillus iheyensis]BAC14912.1 flagellar hook-basal body protein [Oceanobacillus iheyensis HTE831]